MTMESKLIFLISEPDCNAFTNCIRATQIEQDKSQTVKKCVEKLFEIVLGTQLRTCD